MEKSDRDISQWDARLKEQLERSFHNYHKRRIDLSIARDNKKFDWTGETIIVEKASSSDATATVRLMFDDADPLTLEENVEIESIFNRIYLSNAAQADEWLDVIAGINFKYKKKIAEAGGYDSRFSVHRMATQSIPRNEWTKVQLNVERYDVLSEFDNVTNYRFVAKENGYYDFKAVVGLSGISSDLYVCAALRLNNIAFAEVRLESSISGNFIIPISGDEKLTAGEYVELFILHNGSIAFNLIGDYENCFMTGHRFA